MRDYSVTIYDKGKALTDYFTGEIKDVQKAVKAAMESTDNPITISIGVQVKTIKTNLK